MIDPRELCALALVTQDEEDFDAAAYATGFLEPNYTVPAFKTCVEISPNDVEIFTLTKELNDTDDDFIIWWETVALWNRTHGDLFR